MDHPHSAIARRLKRASGHLETIIEMVEQGRPCAQIAQQLQAVESAIENAKKALIHDHVSHSLERSFKASGSKLFPSHQSRTEYGRGPMRSTT